MALLPRKGRDLSYQQHIPVTANLKAVDGLVTPLLTVAGDYERALESCRGQIRQDGPGRDPRGDGRRGAVGLVARHRERRAPHRRACFDRQNCVVRPDLGRHGIERLEPRVRVRPPRPPVELLIAMYGIGLNSVVGMDSRYPLMVFSTAVYRPDEVSRLLADALLALRAQGAEVDAAILDLAGTVVRG